MQSEFQNMQKGEGWVSKYAKFVSVSAKSFEGGISDVAERKILPIFAI